MPSFFDTNVLLYAQHPGDPRKQGIARTLLVRGLGEGTAVLSTQVLQELFVNATRKLGLPAAEARALVELYSRARVVQVAPDLILRAIDLHRLNAISFWDALVVCAAEAAHCGVLFSEDLHAGQVLNGVKIVNPFG
jgi:predicted nucleic acid-binding protein